MDNNNDSPVGLYFRHTEVKQLNGCGFEKTYRIDRRQYPVTPGQEFYVASVVGLYCNDKMVYSASISSVLEVLGKDAFKNKERVTKDEYDAAYYRALQAITKEHQESQSHASLSV